MEISKEQIATLFAQAKYQLDVRQEMGVGIGQKQSDDCQELKQKQEESQGRLNVEKKYEIPAAWEKLQSMDEHRLTIPELEKKLQTNAETGLDKSEAQKRLEVVGKNKLEIHLNQKLVVPKGDILTFVPHMTNVIRNGLQIYLPTEQLVPGDLVVFRLGDLIGADIRIVESNGFKVNNQNLTGVNMLLEKSPECSHPDNPLRTKNLVFTGQHCQDGGGKGIVLFTGINTILGEITRITALAHKGKKHCCTII